MAQERRVTDPPGDFLEPARGGRWELVEKRSRFIGDLRGASSEEGARNILRTLAQETPEAHHHCWAYRVGFPQIREYWSDDGEPSGSAGKPILGALRRAEVTNALLVVTRYFGGIKLGVRGLIDAYGQTATGVLAATPLAWRRQERKGKVVLRYDLHQAFCRRLQDLGVREEGLVSTFGESVTVRFAVPLAGVKAVEGFCQEFSRRGGVESWQWEEPPSAEDGEGGRGREALP